MTIPEKKTFDDAETQKVVEDSMFEDLGLSDDTESTSETPDGGAAGDEGSNVPEEGAADYEKALEEASADIPEDGNESEDSSGADATADTNPAEDLDAFLAELEAANAVEADAQANLEEVVGKSNDPELEKAYADLAASSAEKDRKIEMLTKHLEAEKTTSDKLLDEKLMLEGDVREKSKIADAVMQDDDLKSIVVYKSKSGDDPVAKEKYISILKQMFEGATGISLEDLMSKARLGEKSGMGGGSYATPATPNGQDTLGGMLEDLA